MYCASKLKQSDVALNFPFKHEFKRLFNQWAAEQIEEQIGLGEIIGLKHLTGLANLRPLVLEWAYQSWWALYNEKPCIVKAWQRCVLDFYDVYDIQLQYAAMAASARREIEPAIVPAEEEGEHSEQSDDELEVARNAHRLAQICSRCSSGRSRSMFRPRGRSRPVIFCHIASACL